MTNKVELTVLNDMKVGEKERLFLWASEEHPGVHIAAAAETQNEAEKIVRKLLNDLKADYKLYKW